MTLADDLKAARQYLVDNGRTTKKMFGDDGKVCLAGAVQIVVRPRDQRVTYENEKRIKAAIRALRKHLSPPPCRPTLAAVGRIAAFNDDPATTDEDVLNLIDKALAELGSL